jgi:hypothetical protein
MTTFTIRPAHVLAVLTIGAALLLGADGSAASTDTAPTGCHGLSPASAAGCPASAYTP